MTTKLYLDDRWAGNAPAPLKLAIRKNGKAAYVSLDITISPEHWDKKTQKVIVHPQKAMLNNIIAGKKFDIDKKLFELQESGKLATLSATQIKEMLTKKEEVKTFGGVFREFVETKKERTREIYEATWNHLERHASPMALSFEEITPRWLTEFDEYLKDYSTAKNARNIHFRNIRAVFNYAIDNEYTHYYPFRKFKIKNEETRKRSVNAEILRKVFALETSKYQKNFQTAFKLMFLLIGINTIDLCNIKIVDGRIDYTRRKTHKYYSIKLEPEMMECIEELRGEKHLLYILDHYTDYRNFAKKYNEALKDFSDELGIPKMTTYWARHSWATIAHSIGISKDVISMALGHSFGNKVTDVYVDYNRELVDDANRKVIDYVLKKGTSENPEIPNTEN